VVGSDLLRKLDGRSIVARRNVICTPMFKYRRAAPKTPFLGWGFTAIRKETTEATSPRLLKYRSCIAGKMTGKHGTLEAIQTSFREAAHACSRGGA